MSDDLKNKLIEKAYSLVSAARIYENILENSYRSNLPESDYISNLKKHQNSLLVESEHNFFKKESFKCLACPNVVDCKKKCDDL